MQQIPLRDLFSRHRPVGAPLVCGGQDPQNKTVSMHPGSGEGRGHSLQIAETCRNTFHRGHDRRAVGHILFHYHPS
jgi:hypothetical protein